MITICGPVTTLLFFALEDEESAAGPQEYDRAGAETTWRPHATLVLTSSLALEGEETEDVTRLLMENL